MEEAVKYLVWLGLIVAIIGGFFAISGSAVVKYFALAELIIGIIVGLLMIGHDPKDMLQKGIFYVAAGYAMGLFKCAWIAGILAWFAAYFNLMAWMYIFAAFVVYIVKGFKEGF